MTASRPLTYGDTFTLPSTRDGKWRIIDARPHRYPRDGHASITGPTAEAVYQSFHAAYTPGKGWRDATGNASAEVVADLNTLNVTLEPRTYAQWRDLTQKQLREEVSFRLESFKDNSDIPWKVHGPLTRREAAAHVGAVAACTVAGEPVGGDLYAAVYQAAFDTITD